MNDSQKLGIAIATASVALGAYFIAKAFIHPASKYEVDDVISCYRGETFLGFYTILDKKWEGSTWIYQLAQGKHTTTPVLGWYTEAALWCTDQECYLHER